ncbi:reverse transcriptase domain-containing protein [Tanacetum coccineum]
MTITEGSLRRHLKLDDQDGLSSIPNSEIFEQLALMGYHIDSDKLTFQKGAFPPQWRFLIHSILYCLSPKKTAWEQFSSNIATVVICLTTNRKYNFYRMIFEHMVSNISSPHKFLMYPRPESTLFPTMLDVTEPSTSPSRITEPSTSPLRITSSPSYSPGHAPSPTPEHITAAPTQPSPTQPSSGADHHLPTPNESPIYVVHSHRSDEGRFKLNELTYLVTKLFDRIGVLEDDLKTTKQTYSSAFTKLILRVKKLEAQVKIGKARRRARIVQSDDEDIADDSSKQGRILSDAEVQEKSNQESSEKGSAEVSTAGAKKGTASEEVLIVSIAEVNLSTAGGTITYSRRSEEQRKRKNKGKSIMTESEPKKKSKKELEQERLSFAKAIRLEEQMNEEQRAQIARDEEIARQWDEEERQRAMSEAKTSKKIDWNDPSVIRYHTLKMKPKTVAQARRNMIKYLKNQGNYKISDFKGMSYNEIRPIFEKVWDFNQHIEPMDSEHGSEKMKSPKEMKSAEKIEEEDVATQKEMTEVSKESGAKRKKSIPRKSTRKRQKMEEDAEKEELKGFLDIIPREEVPIEVESLSTKFAIMDWKTCVLIENFMYYQIFRGDGSSKNYKILSEMLKDFDRQDVEELYKLVKESHTYADREEIPFKSGDDFQDDEKEIRGAIRFGPETFITMGRAQLRNNNLRRKVQSRTGRHPQTNGLVERANRSLGEGIKARLGKDNKNWMEEISHVLWAHRTMVKSSNGDTPFSLTYRTEAVISAEIGMPTFRTTELDMAKNDKALQINLELLEEKREQAAITEAKSKRQMEKILQRQSSKHKLYPGDLVFHNNEASRAEDTGKLGPKWEGPYEIT